MPPLHDLPMESARPWPAIIIHWHTPDQWSHGTQGAVLLLARCLRLLFLLLQLCDACLFLRVHANRFFRGSNAVLWKWCMYMRGGLHQMRRLVLLRLLPVHGAGAAMLCCGSGACTCVGDCTKCGAWCCCACCLSTAGWMWRRCGWRALTEPLPWMGDGFISLAGSMFGQIDDAFDSGTTGRVGMFGTHLQRQCFRLRRHGGSRARIQGHVQ